MQKEQVGHHLVEMVFPDNHKIDARTIQRFNNFFEAMDEESKNEIIIIGTINLLFEAFSEKHEREKAEKFIDKYLLRHEKDQISYKRYVRYA